MAELQCYIFMQHSFLIDTSALSANYYLKLVNNIIFVCSVGVLFLHKGISVRVSFNHLWNFSSFVFFCGLTQLTIWYSVFVIFVYAVRFLTEKSHFSTLPRCVNCYVCNVMLTIFELYWSLTECAIYMCTCSDGMK